jgi:hypothetical protein
LLANNKKYIFEMTDFGDRYGYYQIGDVKTYSRFDLMDLHAESPQAWKWHYNDEFFNAYDWAVEPRESIDELYRNRAEQLRRDYDYLVLYYSGGYDSANMLYAFLDNGIYPDEICVFYSRHDTVSNQYLELRDHTWKKLAEIAKKYPQIKIRKVDYSDYFFNWSSRVKEVNPDQDLIYNFGTILSLNHMMMDLSHRYIDDWKHILDNGQKMAWIHGAEKPSLRYLDDKWIFNFHDGLIRANITPLRQKIDNGKIGVYEFFYWAPTETCAKIMIKQCHLLKQLYDPQAQKDFSQIPGARPCAEGYGHSVDTMSLPFTRTIYPRNFAGNEQFFTIKNSSHVWGNRDQWYFNSDHPGSQEHWAMYRSTFSEKYQHWRQWYHDGNSIASGIKNAMSRDYII